MLSKFVRPIFWLGHGIRLANAVALIEPLLARFRVPTITSWAGKDMLRHDHPLFYGHAGVYGHRNANLMVQNADLIIAIGTRLSLMQTGYDLAKFAPQAQIFVVDVDEAEASKIGKRVVMDAGEWMWSFMDEPAYEAPLGWKMQCDAWLHGYPHVDSEYTNGPINPYQFCLEISKYLPDDAIVTTDMGTALLCAYPAMNLNGKQRLITSTGLGEMGSGLPLAIGAAVATGKPVMCLNCDGGMMMNLQEMATVQHLKLPIRLVVFDNGGYGMIRLSQDGLKLPHVASGLADMSFPSWAAIAMAFEFRYTQVRNWIDFKNLGQTINNVAVPYLIHVPTDPALEFGPKVKYWEALA